MKHAFFSIFLIALSFASLAWIADTKNEITTSPLITDGRVIVGTAGGELHAFLFASGVRSWDTAIGDRIEETVLFNGDVVALARDGKIARFHSDGRRVWVYDLLLQRAMKNFTYGMASDGIRLYVTTDKGIYTINPSNGSATLYYGLEAAFTPPVFSSPYLLAGSGDVLYAFRPPDKAVYWSRVVGTVWGAPAVQQGRVVVGTLDNMVYGIRVSDGAVDWAFRTDGWVVEKPVLDGSVVIGSHDGYAYSLNRDTGMLEWRTAIHTGASTSAVKATVASQAAVLIGSQQRVYALSADSGQTLWAWEPSNMPTVLGSQQGRLLVGTLDGKLYVHTLDQGCTITVPFAPLTIGSKPVKVQGYAFPDTASVEISLNSGAWERVGNAGAWGHTFSPAQLREGNNLVACRTVLVGIAQEEPSLTTIVKDSSLPPTPLLVSYPLEVRIGEPITITVIDGETYEPVSAFEFIGRDGLSYTGDEDGNLLLQPDTPHIIDATVHKPGYQDARITIRVFDPEDISMLMLIGGALLVVALILLFVLLKRRKKPRENP